MKLHANAALSLRQRERMVLRVVEQGWSLASAAAAAEVSERTCSKWVARYRTEGTGGLLDRSSAPETVANRTDEGRVEAIAALRRLRFTGPEIADVLGIALSTVSGILTRIGMGRLGRLGLEPSCDESSPRRSRSPSSTAQRPLTRRSPSPRTPVASATATWRRSSRTTRAPR
jgi:transposase